MSENLQTLLGIAAIILAGSIGIAAMFWALGRKP